MRRLTVMEVHARKVAELGLDPAAVDLTSNEAIAGALRRAASFLCPCAAATLVRAVVRPLEGLAEDLEAVKKSVEETLEAMTAHGDYTRQQLLVTNRGPREEGYTYCTKCGLIEPAALPKGVVGAAHRKPFPDSRDGNCPGGGATKGLVLGTDFISDVLLVSVSVTSPLILIPSVLATDVALRTISEALTKAACLRLELEANELQAEYRPALTPAGRDGREAEIYLYDTLPGGAGFAQRVGGLGLLVFEEALGILVNYPENCDRSCYRCLRSYKNKFEHDLLDRHLGASLLRFLIHGTYPTLDSRRLTASTELLYGDLRRQNLEGLTIERNRVLTLPGLGTITAPIYARRADGSEFIIGLHGPLTPDDPPDDKLRDAKESCPSIPVLLCDEIVVRRNLPTATSVLISQIG